MQQLSSGALVRETDITFCFIAVIEVNGDSEEGRGGEGKKGKQFAMFNFNIHDVGPGYTVMIKIHESSVLRAERPVGRQTLNQEEQRMFK